MDKLEYNKLTLEELKKIIEEVYDSRPKSIIISNRIAQEQIQEGIYEQLFKKKKDS